MVSVISFSSRHAKYTATADWGPIQNHSALLCKRLDEESDATQLYGGEEKENLLH